MASYHATWESGASVQFRDLTWKEYKDICTGVDADNISPDTARQVYDTCCLVGPDLRLVTLGVAMFVARHQIVNNPFSGDPRALKSVLNTARSYVESNYLLYAQALVSNAFKYTPEEINEWPAEKLFLRIAQAEIIYGRRIDPADPTQPSKPKPKQKPTAKELATQRHQESLKG